MALYRMEWVKIGTQKLYFELGECNQLYNFFQLSLKVVWQTIVDAFKREKMIRQKFFVFLFLSPTYVGFIEQRYLF